MAQFTSTLIWSFARFGARVAHVFLLRDGALARDRAASEQNAFQQRRLAAAVWSYQGHGAWPLFLHGFLTLIASITLTQGCRGAAGVFFPRLWAASRAPLVRAMLAPFQARRKSLIGI